ncbi:MAG: GNAT family N-acetyltransferase [Anaerolineae bacterium]|nr:GNAT family N-acetyltransferase [Anaerolineae bacterium]
MWQTCRLDDKAEILAFLQRDPIYSAYAIGDLEPGLWEQTAWVGAYRGGDLGALTLHFTGLRLPALVLMGETEGLSAILRAARPEPVYVTCRPEHLALAQGAYDWPTPTAMWRMALRRELFTAPDDPAESLGPDDAGRLAALYALGSGNAFDPSQMLRGVFYGIFLEGELVSAAGTHLVSRAYGVAAVGNVFTHPVHRGRGYATLATGAVVSALLAGGIETIVLNVAQSNQAALAVYARLGFAYHCPFLEGPARACVSSAQ